jgi:hypothetical protein
MRRSIVSVASATDWPVQGLGVFIGDMAVSTGEGFAQEFSATTGTEKHQHER